MNRPALIFHSAYWPIAFAAWLFLTQANHPTWMLRSICTFLLVSASAFYACCVLPRKAAKSKIAFSAVTLFLVGAATAGLIHEIYDLVLGPDPRRFSLAANILMDTAFVLINTLIAGAVAWTVAAATGVPVWWLRSSADDPS